jgi:hypothetical protein
MIPRPATKGVAPRGKPRGICAVRGCISFYVIDNLGMEKRPRRFSLAEAFFEGTALASARTVLSTRNLNREEKAGQGRKIRSRNKRAEFRSAEKNVSGTALRT